MAAGKSLTPYFRFDQAKTILSLDCDFIAAEGDTHLHCRNFARSRRPQNGAMSRLYLAEALMSQTGMNADHRARVASSQVIAIAAAVASKLGVAGVDTGKFPLPANVSDKWVSECASDLKANVGAALVVA